MSPRVGSSKAHVPVGWRQLIDVYGRTLLLSDISDRCSSRCALISGAAILVSRFVSILRNWLLGLRLTLIVEVVVLEPPLLGHDLVPALLEAVGR